MSDLRNHNVHTEEAFIVNPHGVVKQVGKSVAAKLVHPSMGKPGYSMYTGDNAQADMDKTNHGVQKQARKAAAKPAPKKVEPKAE